MSVSYQDVWDTHTKWLYLAHDPDLLHMAFATVIANRYDGKPVWLMIAGPPGAGKTASITGLMGAEECYKVSNLTPAALGSGSTGSSFLENLSNKVMIIPDFSTISEMPKEARSQLLAFLRDAYDGSFTRVTGRSATPVTWEGKFGMIGCTTAVALNSALKENQALGERFMTVRMRITDDDTRKMMKAAAKMSMGATKMKEELEGVSRQFLMNFVPPTIGLPASFNEMIQEYAFVIARMRGLISRDRETREVDMLVSETVEVPTRLVNQLKALSIGLLCLDCNTEDLRRILKRITVDASASLRRVVMEKLVAGVQGPATIGSLTGFSGTTISRTLEELDLLGMTKKIGGKFEPANDLLREIYS